jgi:6,7-dimethyl-8-ribityllumazine synthase
MSLDPRSKGRRRPRRARARIGVVVSSYHGELTQVMLASALAELGSSGILEARIVPAPGVFEIPLLARELARRKDIDAVLCFGLVLRGETTHDHWVAHGAVTGLVQATLETGKPLALGILTCARLAQAKARAKPKGREVARAALDSLEALRLLRRSRK